MARTSRLITRLFILTSVALLLGAGVGRATPVTFTLVENGANPYGTGSNVISMAGPGGIYSFTFAPTSDSSGIS